MTLTGPSRTIVVEPLQAPAETRPCEDDPPPEPEPGREVPAPTREPAPA